MLEHPPALPDEQTRRSRVRHLPRLPAPEQRLDFVVRVDLSEDDVARLKASRVTHGNIASLTAHDADPRLLADRELSDRVAVGGRALLHDMAFEAIRLLSEAHVDRPRSRLDESHRDPEQSREPGHEAALEEH